MSKIALAFFGGFLVSAATFYLSIWMVKAAIDHQYLSTPECIAEIDEATSK